MRMVVKGFMITKILVIQWSFSGHSIVVRQEFRGLKSYFGLGSCEA